MGKRACGFVIFRRSQGKVEYLLMQTMKSTQHWSPPKGHVEYGEADMETALRETSEESGLLESDLKIFENVQKETSYVVKGKTKTSIYWLAELINTDKDARLSAEHQAFKWLPIDEACEISLQALQEALRFFDDYITKNLL